METGALRRDDTVPPNGVWETRGAGLRSWVLARSAMLGLLFMLVSSLAAVQGCVRKGPMAPTGGTKAPPRASEQGAALLPGGNGLPGQGSVAGPLRRKGAGATGSGPALSVTYKSPEGLVDGSAAVLVTFSQPMTALGLGGAGRFPVEIQPVQSVQRRWVSGDTAKLAFEKPLPLSTRFVVTVRPDARSLLGNRLQAPVRWTFETPRVQLQSARHRGELLGRRSVLVSFNQPVSLGELRAKVSVTLDGKPWPVTWRRREDIGPARVFMIPRDPWPAGGHKVLIRIPKGFHGVQGPLGTRKDQEAGLRTPGPLRVWVTCQGWTLDKARGCWPLANEAVPGFGLQTSTPVERGALLGALRIQPSVGNLSRLLVPVNNLCDKGKVCATSWRVKQPLKPTTTYRVSVAPGLRDIYKERLGRRFQMSFQTRPRPPGLFLPRSARGVLAPGKGMPLSWRGGDLSVRTWHAADGPSAAALLSCLAAKKEAKVLACLEGLRPKRRRLPGGKAGRVTRKISLSSGLSLVRARLRPDQSFLPFYKDTNAWEEGGWLAGWRLVQATDLAVHVRATPFDLLAWVTDMKTGRALSGASVRLWNAKGRMLVHGRSGTDGLVRFSMQPDQAPWKNFDKQGFVLTAEFGARRVLVPLGRWNSAWEDFPLSWMADPVRRAGLDYPGAHRRERTAMSWSEDWTGDRLVPRGWIGTERGIYRPGEDVFVQGAVRVFRTWRPRELREQTASLVLRGPFGDLLVERPVELGPMGAFETRMRIPAAARLGFYRMELKVEGHPLFTSYFRVANFRSPTFWVRASVPDDLGPGHDIALKVLAKTYAGTPVDQAPLHIEVASQEITRRFGKDSFFAGRMDGLVSARRRTWYRRDEYLDGTGRLSVTIPSPRARQAGGHFLTLQEVSVQVMSPGGRTQSARASLTHWPSDLVVGMLRDRERPRRYRIAVFGRAGLRRAATVRVSLLPVVEHERSQTVDWSSPLWSRTLRVGRSGAQIQIPARRFPGHWVVVRFSVTDGKGRSSWTTDALSSEPPSRKEKAAQPRSRHLAESLSLSIPANRYRPGQMVSVTVRRRGKVADGLLILERERIFRVLPLHFGTRKSLTIPIRVEEAYASSVQVVALATVPGAVSRPGRISLLSSTDSLKVDLRHYTLRIQVDPDRSVYGPGDMVNVSVHVTDNRGRPLKAAVILTAVDQAVLALAGSGQSRPLRALMNVPWHQVRAYDLRLTPFDSRIRLLELPAGLGLGRGGGGSGSGYGVGGLGMLKSGRMAPGRAVRRNFVTTPWQKLLVTDAQGRAHASFRLPDNLTTFTILAVAIDKGRRSGLGRGKVLVTRPLFALADLPRQVRVGDRFLAGVTIYNQSRKPLDLRVTASMQGAVGSDGPAGAKTSSVPAGGSVSVRFPVLARKAGRAVFRFHVCGGGHCDSLEQSLPVSLPTMMRARSVAGVTSRSVYHSIGSLASVLPDRGGLDVRLSSSLLVGLEPGVSQLVSYPFHSSEQDLSRLVGLMAAARLLPKGSGLPKAAKGASLSASIRERIEQVMARYNSDQGLPFWPGGQSSLWASAYGIIVLDLARRQGLFQPPKGFFERAGAFLEKRLKAVLGGGKARGPGRRVFASARSYEPRPAALAALALSRLGKASLVRRLVHVLHDRHQDGSLAQQAQLMAALAPWAKSAGDRKLLAWYRRKVESRIRAQGPSAHAESVTPRSWWPFDSMVRDTALTLLALLAMDPNHPMAQRMARWLVLDRKTAEFRTTQDAAWSLMALWAWSDAGQSLSSGVSAGLWLGRRLLFELHASKGRSSVRSAHVSMRRLRHLLVSGSGRVVVGVQGKGRVYYTLRLRSFDKKLPLTSEDRGFAVRRTLQRLDRSGRIVSGTPRFGDQVLVTLEVTSREAHRFVAVEDPLPGGLEPVDLQLRTATRNWDLLKHLSHMSRFDHRELRDDRVLFFVDDLPAGKATYRYLARVTTPGRFVWPPARAEEMYAPEVSGHNAATWVRLF